MYNRLVELRKAVVVDLDDPAGLNRIKVRILSIDGPFCENTYSPIVGGTAVKNIVANESLLWAEVCYPFGNNTRPVENSVVLVGFLNGNAKHPIILGWLGYNYGSVEEQLADVLLAENQINI